MDIRKETITIFNFKLGEEELQVITKGITMAVSAGRVGSIRLSLNEKRMLRTIVAQMQSSTVPVIPRELIEDEEDEDEPEERIR